MTSLLAELSSGMRASQQQVYSNSGNPPLIDLMESGYIRILDIGCGAGDNAALVKARWPETRLFGITHNPTEAHLARPSMERCWVFDIEEEFPSELEAQSFDALIFSHVLEHFREPSAILARFSRLLCSGGIVLIAVPNVLSWRQRLQFLIGRFEYESAGIMDDTHLRFFTYITADQYLFARSPDLILHFKGVTGSIPLWWLRRHVLPERWAERLDRWGCHHWPNLFGGQILIKATKS